MTRRAPDQLVGVGDVVRLAIGSRRMLVVDVDGADCIVARPNVDGEPREYRWPRICLRRDNTPRM